MKKLCAVFIIFVVLVSALSITAIAAEPEYSDNVRSALASGVTIFINGVEYYIPSGASTTIGYGYVTSGTYVGICQMALNRVDEITADSIVMSANCNAGAVDYLFGPVTKGAIENFQWYNNNRMAGNPQLTIDGICGNATWARLAYYSY